MDPSLSPAFFIACPPALEVVRHSHEKECSLHGPNGFHDNHDEVDQYFNREKRENSQSIMITFSG
jgi:hypothetical protein